MVNLGKFLIELDRDPPLFAPGNRVTGKLLIVNNEQTKINTLYIELRGRAEVDL